MLQCYARIIIGSIPFPCRLGVGAGWTADDPCWEDCGGWLGEPDWGARWGSSCEVDSTSVIMHGGPVGTDWFQMRRFFACRCVISAGRWFLMRIRNC